MYEEEMQCFSILRENQEIDIQTWLVKHQKDMPVTVRFEMEKSKAVKEVPVKKCKKAQAKL